MHRSLTSAREVQLVELTPDPRKEKCKEKLTADLCIAMFHPAAYPQGRVIYHFTTSLETDHAYLEDFQPWRRVYIVNLAVVD